MIFKTGTIKGNSLNAFLLMRVRNSFLPTAAAASFYRCILLAHELLSQQLKQRQVLLNRLRNNLCINMTRSAVNN